MNEKVKITQEELDGILKVRALGKTNMFDFNAVHRFAFENEDYETVIWMQENKDSYSQIIFGNFEIVEK